MRKNIKTILVKGVRHLWVSLMGESHAIKKITAIAGEKSGELHDAFKISREYKKSDIAVLLKVIHYLWETKSRRNKYYLKEIRKNRKLYQALEKECKLQAVKDVELDLAITRSAHRLRFGRIKGFFSGNAEVRSLDVQNLIFDRQHFLLKISEKEGLERELAELHKMWEKEFYYIDYIFNRLDKIIKKKINYKDALPLQKKLHKIIELEKSDYKL